MNDEIVSPSQITLIKTLNNFPNFALTMIQEAVKERILNPLMIDLCLKTLNVIFSSTITSVDANDKGKRLTLNVSNRNLKKDTVKRHFKIQMTKMYAQLSSNISEDFGIIHRMNYI